MGRAFELLCLCHVGQIKRALGISGMATSVSSWRQLADKANQDSAKREGAQIDLIIDRADRMVQGQVIFAEHFFSTSCSGLK